ncbi:MAG TPA: LysR family transcriptional regulator [Burkholderiaceae bacterium]|jgi:DNA-binding transcriptional LysR family regulator|nr:LysR family transcriptional regulator [Burkholderiaceae bacterium]
MDKTQIDWALYRSFLAALREGSLSAAARSLGMTQPSIGRHIDALEALLGVSLFTRAQDGLRPTRIAFELRGPAEAMAAAAQQALRIASGTAEDERGTVRVTASNIVGAAVLPPMLTRYRERNPHVELELVLTNRNTDLLKREADIAVRMMRPTQQALIAKRIGITYIGMFAHRRYVEERGLPKNVMELKQHTLIGFDQDPAALQLLQKWGGAIQRDDFSFRSDSELAQLSALRAGFGIGGCQIGIARNDPDMIPVLPHELLFELDMWLVTHDGLRRNMRVMNLFEFLAGELTGYIS